MKSSCYLVEPLRSNKSLYIACMRSRMAIPHFAENLCACMHSSAAVEVHPVDAPALTMEVKY